MLSDDCATIPRRIRRGGHWCMCDDRSYFLFFLTLLGTSLLPAIIACFNVAGLLFWPKDFVLVVLGAGAVLIIDALLRN
jgi:hypothetical protein